MTFDVRKNQRGMALTSVMIAIIISTMLAVYAGTKVVAELNSAVAESTGSYMMSVRGAVLKSLSEHSHAYTLLDISSAPAGTYPTAPPWATFAGSTNDINIRDLKDAGLLLDDFPDTPPLGRSVHVRFIRSGSCPGTDCSVEAYIYTCWPINSGRPGGEIDITTCPAPPEGWEESSTLVGDVILATEGHGGTNLLDPARIHGTLFNQNSSALGLASDRPGVVAVLASLNNTLHNQFLRQGDTRNVFLQGSFTVDGFLRTNTGLLIETNYEVGTTCDNPRMYATSDRQSLIQCQGGYWYELANHVISNHQEVANGELATAATCPGSNLQPFYIATMGHHDTRMTGAGDISIQGSISGTTSITGYVDDSGSLSGSSSISGNFNSNDSSFISVNQSVSIDQSTRRVTITNAQPGARAVVISGCRASS